MITIELIYNIFFNIHRTNGDINGIAIAFITFMLILTAYAVLEYNIEDNNY